MRQCLRTEQNRTEQNRTEQNRIEQNRTEQNRTEHLDYLGQGLFVKLFLHSLLSFLGSRLFFVSSRNVVA